jgi:hypothetical protein
MDEKPDVTYRRLLQKSARGYCLLVTARMVHFTRNYHLTPDSPIDISHLNKKPRLIYDTSCAGTNDWTTKPSEPPPHFRPSFHNSLEIFGIG